jgi:hypothetical protein
MSNPVIEKGVDILSRFLDEHPSPTGEEVEGVVRTLFAQYHIGKMGVEPITPSNRGCTISMRVDGLSLDLYRAGAPSMIEAIGRELAEKTRIALAKCEEPRFEDFLKEGKTNGILVMFACRPLKPEEIYKDPRS